MGGMLYFVGKAGWHWYILSQEAPLKNEPIEGEGTYFKNMGTIYNGGD
jgi:hypothetical protein